VAFAALREDVVVGRGEPAQLVETDERVRQSAELADDPTVLVVVEPVAEVEVAEFQAEG